MRVLLRDDVVENGSGNLLAVVVNDWDNILELFFVLFTVGFWWDVSIVVVFGDGLWIKKENRYFG